MSEHSTGRLRFCTSCGAAAGGSQFCTACGASLQSAPSREPQSAPPVQLTKTPPAVPPPAGGPGPDAVWGPSGRAPVGTGRPRRSRTVVGVLLVVVLLLGAAAGGAFWLLRDDGRSDAEIAAADPTPDPAEGGSPLEATPSSTPTTTAPASSVRCWDGSRTSRLTSCPAGPQGVAGLEWVFPGLDRARCPQSSADRELLMACPADARGVRLNFSRYDSFLAAKSHYDALTGDDAASPISGDRLAWYSDGVYRNNEYKGAIVYDGEPFAVSVYAPTAELRDQTMNTLRMRPKTQLRGVRDGS